MIIIRVIFGIPYLFLGSITIMAVNILATILTIVEYTLKRGFDGFKISSKYLLSWLELENVLCEVGEFTIVTMEWIINGKVEA